MAKKILVLDDDLYIRELYEEVLKNEGYDVDSAVDGDEGLGKLQKGEYDLVLLDVMMPKLDGLGVLDALAKNPPAIKNGPIILLTNLGQEPLLEKAKTKGAISYLIKAEITPNQLVAKVKEFLGEQITN